MKNAILNYWQPKDIPEVLSEFDKITGIDKLIFRYMKYPLPHEALDTFLEDHTNYDWLIIMTNDLVVTQSNLEQLYKDMNKGYNVISGVCNVDTDENKDNLNVCKVISADGYDWVKRGELSGIQRVEFAGFPLTAIHRDVFEQFKFYIPDYHNFATDKRFCQWCKDNQIPIHANFDNEMIHLRFHGQFRWDQTGETIFKPHF